MAKKIGVYALIIFFIVSVLFIFIAPIIQVKKIEADSKRPKSQRVMK